MCDITRHAAADEPSSLHDCFDCSDQFLAKIVLRHISRCPQLEDFANYRRRGFLTEHHKFRLCRDHADLSHGVDSILTVKGKTEQDHIRLQLPSESNSLHCIRHNTYNPPVRPLL